MLMVTVISPYQHNPGPGGRLDFILAIGYSYRYKEEQGPFFIRGGYSHMGPSYRERSDLDIT